MNNHLQSWQRLAAAARQHRDEFDETAPYGFAVRVANQALDSTTAVNPWGLIEKFALRGLIAACTFSLAAMAFGFISSGNSEHDDEVAATDTVGEILDLS